MAEIVITFHDSYWLDLQTKWDRLAETASLIPPSFPQDIGFMLEIAKRDLPDVPTRLFPTLGFAVAEIQPLEVNQVMDNWRGGEGVKDVSLPNPFEIIRPMGRFLEMDIQGELPPSWHFNLTGIDRLRAKGLSGKDVLVGVLDSGVDLKTPQLSGRVAAYASFDELGGKVEAPMVDTLPHGTCVCGIIAGEEIGVAPQAKLAVGRVAPDGVTTFSQILGGLEWLCANFPALRLINLSLGKIDTPSTDLITLVERLGKLGKLLICAIGNDGRGTSRTPGNLNLAGVLGVGAVDGNKSVASWSGGMAMEYGGSAYTKPDLVMPGVHIPLCVPGGKVKLSSGTSFAAPMLTGFGALILEAKPEMDPVTLRQTLLASCEDLPVPPDRDGHGLPEATRLPL